MAEENTEVAGGVPEGPRLNVSQNEKNLIVAFLQFIRAKSGQGPISQEQAETLEIAIQCLEGTFNIDDGSYAFQPSRPLIDLFTEAEGVSSGESSLPTPTDADIAQANKLKEEGNDLMKASQFDAAVAKYNAAIKLNRDPVYFCNRAAAYCRLDQYDLAIQDCRTALALDPQYSKAWGRMGLAYSCLNRYDHAAEAYKKALELEPNQESYKNNLKIAEDKLKELESQRPAADANPFANLFGGLGGLGGGPGAGGLPNMGAMFNDPNLMNAASQMMNDPAMASVFQNLMGGNASIGDLMAAGQQMASRMQETNPDIIDNLRRQFQGGPDGSNPPPAPPQ
uniref:SGTA homodimerisation domain-containing protein n=1 Tax=Caenorhabditis japonica TaxID=281687 RepID=A0A8R1DI42_CAEJA